MFNGFTGFYNWGAWDENILEGGIKEEDREALIKQLGMLNIAIGVTYSSVFALFLYLEYILYERVKLLDLINDTNYASNLKNVEENEEISGTIFFFATTVFLLLNMEGLYDLVESGRADESDILTAQNRVAASVLSFVAVYMSRNDFNL